MDSHLISAPTLDCKWSHRVFLCFRVGIPLGHTSAQYNQRGRNMKWRVRNGSHHIWNLYISAPRLDSNVIPTVMSEFPRSSNPLELVSIPRETALVDSWKSEMAAFKPEKVYFPFQTIAASLQRLSLCFQAPVMANTNGNTVQSNRKLNIPGGGL